MLGFPLLAGTSSSALHHRAAIEVDKSELVRAAARLIVEEVLEEEVTDALGRDFYEHGAKSGSGYRNGYRRGA